MSLFQPIIVKSYLDKINQEELSQAWIKFQKHFHDTEIQANIKASKEEQYQEGFLRDLFVNVFGYILNPTTGFNLTTELKNFKGSKKCDGAVLKDSKALAVIELKSMDTTDLSSIESQAFGYKNYHTNCRYVITSNFQKLRFYIDNAVEYEEFDLFKINQSEFKLLYLLLKSENLINNLPLKIKNDSIGQEKKITDQLYEDYSAFKRALFNDITKNNPQFDQLILFQKSQKLLDRFLFIFFSEDRGLLSANTSRTMLKEWEESKRLKLKLGLYDHIKNYFSYLNTGYKDEHSEIYAYNGGLFKPDEVLDTIIISHDILHIHIGRIADYDFASEVDVGILGHIFEHSLTEIDEIKAIIQGVNIEKTTSKRKKDGVFYTPKYITNYIVENTVGRLCADKKTELEIVDENYVFFKFANPKTKKFAEQAEKYANYQKRLQKLNEYRDWLLNITICDPACGSGAFLNEALNFLINEHRYIDELSSKIGGGDLVFQEVRNHILENNLFGVDINQESVEIAKLSLWLSTAEPHRKLSNLNENIKCGNSLIDDPKVVGDKAFDWAKEFPKVFERGGFDILIGNPPYVRMQGLREAYPETVNYYNRTYQSATGNFDIYVMFMEKSLDLINPNGLISFILPHKFLVTDFGIGIRKFFVEKHCVESLLHFGSELVFEDASTYTCIIDLNLKPKEKIQFKKINPLAISQTFEWDKMDYDLLTENNWDLQTQNIFKIIDKLKTQPFTVGNVFNRVFQGIASGGDKFFNLKLIEKKDDVGLFYSDILEKEVELELNCLKPIIKGNQISKYEPLVPNQYTIFPYTIENGKALPMSFTTIEKKYPLLSKYYLDNETFLRNREKGRFNNENEWFLFSRSQGISNVEIPKIMTQEISLGCNMTYDEYGDYYHSTTVYSFVKNPKFEIDDKFYLAILNSKLMWFFLKNTGTELSGGFFRFKTNYLKPFPLPKIPENAQIFIEKVDEILTLTKELKVVKGKFLRTLERKFDLIEVSKNLQAWQNLIFKDFIKELGKKKIKLTLSDEAELEDYFLAEQTKAQAIQVKVSQLDKEINSMVYQLYDLTDEEIEVIESNTELSD